MFMIPWEAKITGLKAVGNEGENKLQMVLVAAAEDAMLQTDSVGTACRQAYKLVKAGKTGTIPVYMPKRWLCKLKMIYDVGGKPKTFNVSNIVPETLSIVATAKDDQPPKVKMVVSIEYKDAEVLAILHAFKKQATVDIQGADGKGYPEAEAEVGPPKKRTNGRSTDGPKPDAPPPA